MRRPGELLPMATTATMTTSVSSTPTALATPATNTPCAALSKSASASPVSEKPARTTGALSAPLRAAGSSAAHEKVPAAQAPLLPGAAHVDVAGAMHGPAPLAHAAHVREASTAAVTANIVAVGGGSCSSPSPESAEPDALWAASPADPDDEATTPSADADAPAPPSLESVASASPSAEPAPLELVLADADADADDAEPSPSTSLDVDDDAVTSSAPPSLPDGADPEAEALAEASDDPELPADGSWCVPVVLAATSSPSTTPSLLEEADASAAAVLPSSEAAAADASEPTADDEPVSAPESDDPDEEAEASAPDDCAPLPVTSFSP
mmetsp:Transcript_3078/g.11033  ORF Transcript_3078/g.11033 Transcript_3078/m.11033 type:complete len:326 (-) Transcript_3078:3366-4343(-)